MPFLHGSLLGVKGLGANAASALMCRTNGGGGGGVDCWDSYPDYLTWLEGGNSPGASHPATAAQLSACAAAPSCGAQANAQKLLGSNAPPVTTPSTNVPSVNNTVMPSSYVPPDTTPATAAQQCAALAAVGPTTGAAVANFPACQAANPSLDWSLFASTPGYVAPTSPSTTPATTNWLTESTIFASVENWIVLAGAAAALYFLPSLMGGKRG